MTTTPQPTSDKPSARALLEASEKATPGPWACEDMFAVITTVEQDLDVAFPQIALTDFSSNACLGDKQNDDNAAYIALANPLTIKALVADWMSLREALVNIKHGVAPYSEREYANITLEKLNVQN